MANPDYIDMHLQPMGLSAAEHSTDSMNVDSDVEFGDDPTSIPFPVHVIKTNSLDQVKTWIGNSDKKTDYNTQAAEMDFSAMPANTDDLTSLAAAARHYVYQDSDTTNHLVPAIEKGLGPFEVMVAATNVIKIAPGKTLTYSGEKPKVVVADELIFEGKGSKIDSFVHLRMAVKSVVVNS